MNKDIPGFVSNRLQYAVLREALHLVETGVVSAQDVDRTLKCGVGFRYPWLGPLETADLGGLDVFHGVSQYLFKELSSMTAPPEFFDGSFGKAGWASRPARVFTIIAASCATRCCASAISILFAS